MNQFQQNWCKKIMGQLMEFQVSKIFLKNQDLRVPQYRFYVKNPITLTDIQNRLQNEHYNSVSDWAYDVRLTFLNAIHAYDSHSPIHVAAQFLNSWFTKHASIYPLSEKDEWIITFQNLQKKSKQIQNMGKNNLSSTSD